MTQPFLASAASVKWAGQGTYFKESSCCAVPNRSGPGGPSRGRVPWARGGREASLRAGGDRALPSKWRKGGRLGARETRVPGPAGDSEGRGGGGSGQHEGRECPVLGADASSRTRGWAVGSSRRFLSRRVARGPQAAVLSPTVSGGSQGLSENNSYRLQGLHTDLPAPTSHPRPSYPASPSSGGTSFSHPREHPPPQSHTRALWFKAVASGGGDREVS